MNTKSMMRVMLIVLAAIGGAGLLAIFFPGSGITGRLFGTALLSGVAIGLVMAATKKLDKEQWRDGALLMMGVTIASFGLCIVGIWSGFFGFSGEWKVITTAMVLAGCGLAVVPGLVVLKSEAGRWSGLVGMMSSVTAFIAFTLAIWDTKIFSLGDDQLGFTGMGIVIFGGFAAVSVYGIRTERGALRWIIWPGVIVSVIGLLFWMYDVWLWEDSELSTPSQIMVISAVLAHANMVCRVRLKGMARYVLMLTVTSSVITALCLITYIEQKGDMGSVGLLNASSMIRMSAGFGIVTACGTLALIVMRRMSRNVGVFLKKAEYTSMHVRCPHCGSEQDAPVGVSGCMKCGMQFGISIRKPQCAGCGYDTLGVQGEACPECGEKLPQRGIKLKELGNEIEQPSTA